MVATVGQGGIENTLGLDGEESTTCTRINSVCKDSAIQISTGGGLLCYGPPNVTGRGCGTTEGGLNAGVPGVPRSSCSREGREKGVRWCWR